MNRDRRRRVARLAVLSLVILSAGNALALTDEEIFREFRFNFISPGAHALGLGGAYISAAEDATASEANPGALHYVIKKQFFIEFRRRDPQGSTLRPSSGKQFADVGNIAIGSDETFANFVTANDPETTNFPSFASFVYPFRKNRTRLAFSRQVVLASENSLVLGNEQTQFNVSLPSFPDVTVPQPFPNLPITQRYQVSNTVNGFLDAELVHYNVGVSTSLHQDFSLGVTATLARLSMDSRVDSTVVDPFPVLDSIHPRLGDPGQVSDIRNRSTIDDETDTAFAYTIGLHWHPDSAFPGGKRGEPAPVRFGVVYRKGADLSVDQVSEELRLNQVTGQFESVATDRRFIENTLRVPDRWGVGGSYHSKNWIVALDVERVQYSDLLENFQTGVNFFTGPQLQFPETNLPDASALVFDVDDATVVHVGAEYGFTSRGRWRHAFRVGYFNAPDNKIALDRIDDPAIDPLVRDIYLDLFRKGEDVNHFTVGTTLGIPGGVQLQLAGDFSEEEDQVVFSTIVTWGRAALGVK